MKNQHLVHGLSLLIATAMFVAIPSAAQQITGTPGSPSATTTISGKQLPAPDPEFGGVIKQTADESKSWWPPTIVPPKGAPNILLIMTDDQGYGVSGTFGSVIPTPAMDRLASAGLRYTNFNSTALCSPTRAALITGRNHHSVGFGVVGELSTGFPGYDSVIEKDSATIGTILRDNGYATSWFGKNHNTPTFQYSVAGPYDQWPSGMGFDYFYGFMGGESDQWTPYLFKDHTQVTPWIGREDYNLITDMADNAIDYMRGLNAVAPAKPFFVYYVPGGTHSPHQPTKEWIDKIGAMDLFDEGWEKLRERIFANQKRLGVIPADTKLTPWPDGQAEFGGAKLPRWDSLSEIQKKLYIRQAEVFAAYVAYTDYEIGRVIQAVEDMGKLDNTLIIYISGDNGTSPEGTLEGTYNTMTAYNGILTIPEPLQMLHYEDWGSAKTYPHMSVGWTWAFDTPFKWTKQVASHFGGTRQGMVISWPGHISDPGGIRSQFHHMIDIVPTLLEATGIQAPETVNGIQQKPIEGVSMLYTFDKANADAPSKHVTQYFEMLGNRAIYHEGWVAATTPPVAPWMLGKPMPAMDDYKWELYDVSKDFSQSNDLAAQMPAKLKEMQALFLTEAAKYQVLPLSNAGFSRALEPRPSATAGKTEFIYTGVNPGIPFSSAPSILGKDFTITAEVTVPSGGAEGMIVTFGGRFGGYALYLLNGKPVFDYNLLDLERFRWEGGAGAKIGEDFFGRALAPGKHTLVFDFKYAGPGPGKGGTGVLTVDGRELARKTIEHTVPLIMNIDENFDVGLDSGTTLDSSYELPFRFTGTINRLTFKLGPSQVMPAEQAAGAAAVRRATD